MTTAEFRKQLQDKLQVQEDAYRQTHDMLSRHIGHRDEDIERFASAAIGAMACSCQAMAVVAMAHRVEDWHPLMRDLLLEFQKLADANGVRLKILDDDLGFATPPTSPDQG